MTTAEKKLKKRFGATIQDLQEKKRLSLWQGAADCNLKNSNIAKIEGGRFNVSLSTIVELAQGLETHPSKLFVEEFDRFV